MNSEKKDYNYYIKKNMLFRKSIYEGIERKGNKKLWQKADFGDIKKVIIIVSPPRSGSSLLFNILRRIPCICALNGESVPFFKLNGIASDADCSDEIRPEKISEEQIKKLTVDFFGDLHFNYDKPDMDSETLEQYFQELILRFSIQWPEIEFNYDRFILSAKKAFTEDMRKQRRFNKVEYYLELFKELKKEYSSINPYYYDIPPYMIKEKFPDEILPSGPPGDCLMIEEPPFVLVSPGCTPELRDLKEKILLIKEPVNCYRFKILEKMFKNAEISIIQLVRNPAASVNGLIDGWLYRGYFSHNMMNYYDLNKMQPKALNIKGYSDLFPWGKYWWKYDLPPQWEEYSNSPVEEVCSFQWYSANKFISDYLKESSNSSCLVKYENIIRDLSCRYKEFEKIISFLGLSNKTLTELDITEFPIVQATELPGPFRWKKRREQLKNVLNKKEIHKMAEQLGYAADNTGDWL